MKDNFGTVLEYVSSGNAIVFIGSGASSEMGYPSWMEQLSLIEEFATNKRVELSEEYQEYKRQNQIPQAFEYLEERIGRELLLKTLCNTLVAKSPSEDTIYNVLTKWPFQVYLTTNFDNEIIAHLEANGRMGFSTLGNSELEFSALTPDVREYVVKIHGELSPDKGAVVTDRDYDEFKVGESKRYYRKTLSALLQARRVVVVGYSLADPDLQYILNRIREEGSLASPICILLPDPTPQQIEKFARSMSVRVVPYTNTDKKHSSLKKILGLLNSFINPSTSNATHTEDSKNAAALYLFRHLNKNSRKIGVGDNLLLLVPAEKRSACPIEEIAEFAHLSKATCREQLSVLREQKLVSEEKGLYFLSSAGAALISKCHATFEVTKKAALECFIKEIGTALTTREEEQYKCLSDAAISEIFNSRGMSLVNSLWGQSETTSGELLDIYAIVSRVAADIQDLEKRLLFIQAIKKFVFSPSLHQKEYLVALSQGYFMYHLRGNSFAAKEATNTFISKADWYVDSHILQALVADGCNANSFVKELFELLLRKGAKMFVTPGVIEEVLYHFDEADRRSPDKNANFYRTALSLLDDKYNFFLDGFIQSSANKVVQSYKQYYRRVHKVLANRMSATLARYSIKEVRVDTTKRETAKRLNETMEEVGRIRRKKNKEEEPSLLKVRTDAEIYVAMTAAEDEYKRCGRQRNVYFISHSTVFDRVERKLKRWTDFSLYRLLQSFPSEKVPTESMYDCLHSELVSAGLRIVDDSNYRHFFSEQIEAAKLEFKGEYEEYVEQVEADALVSKSDFERTFDSVPDLEKPIFVDEMRMRLSRRDKERVKEEVLRREAAEKESVKYKEEVRRLQEQLANVRAENERINRRNQIDESTLRNAHDPKHISKKLRQAKRRLRKQAKR